MRNSTDDRRFKAIDTAAQSIEDLIQLTERWNTDGKPSREQFMVIKRKLADIRNGARAAYHPDLAFEHLAMNTVLQEAIYDTPANADDKPDPDGSENYGGGEGFDADAAGLEANMDDTLPPTVLGDNEDAPF